MRRVDGLAPRKNRDIHVRLPIMCTHILYTHTRTLNTQLRTLRKKSLPKSCAQQSTSGIRSNKKTHSFFMRNVPSYKQMSRATIIATDGSKPDLLRILGGRPRLVELFEKAGAMLHEVMDVLLVNVAKFLCATTANRSFPVRYDDRRDKRDRRGQEWT